MIAQPVCRPPLRPARRGVFTVALLLVLAVAILLAATSLYWAQLVFVQRSFQARADLMAVAGAPLLLEPAALADASTVVHRVAVGTSSAQAEVHLVREENNTFAPPRLRLGVADVVVTAGRLADAHLSRQATGFQPAALIPSTSELNALRVRVASTTGRANPLGRWFGSLVARLPAQVTAEACASLDNLVVGFRPTARANAPVVPVAIDADAWSRGRTQDLDRNGVNEIELRLKSSQAGATAANAAVVSFAGQLAWNRALAQVKTGVAHIDLPTLAPGLGPATLGHPLLVKGTSQVAQSLTQQLATALGELAVDPTAARVFPLYDARRSSASQLALVGFVGGRIERVAQQAGRLVVRVEPAYVIHFTAWTSSANDPLGPDANRYVFRVGLAR